MNELTVFQNEQYGEIRVVMDGKNEPWFCGKDVLTALEYSEASNPAKVFQIVPDMWRGVKPFHTRSENGAKQQRDMLCLSEQGLYFFLGRSDKPKATPYQMYVANEVLPSIRKHGAYATPATIEMILADPDYGIKLLEALKAEKDKNALLKPKADYFDALVERNTLTGIRETAKELGIRPKEFTTYLLEHGYVYRDHKNKLQPAAAHVESGLFELKECKSNKNNWSGTQLMITPKGRETFRLLMSTAA